MDATVQYFPMMIVGFAAALGLTPISRQIAMRLGVVDKPNAPRKTHKDHKPMMGGLAIYIAFSAALLIFSPAENVAEYAAIVFGAGVLALTGAIDDRYQLSWRLRFIVQVGVAFIIVLSGTQIRMFGNQLIDVPITLIWIVALVNAANFLDNMDGLTAGLSTIASFWFLVIALTQAQYTVAMLAAALFGSSMGFLIYNFNPASTFMGDMGALVLGFVLSVLAIKLEFGSQPLGVSWMVPVLVLALPITDINLVVWTRLAEGRSPAEGGRDHTSHRLLTLRFSPRMTLITLYILCGLYGLLGLIVAISPTATALKIGVSALMLLGVWLILMVYIRERYQKGGTSD
ncbi:undecaprenyl/decaprenyl-phosphate alpha-N-acetylglucosaminyl 1-phosphate transferase [Phototrophicus methaneseepsis]|uniref:Undecaprenyl/decaprenyl-phosphate alpha-N-acetylglucosaminyl 1-phosphate transferase n=1 Tax=Phototrophicus methaneseepsis TaxID=2710758 RepID=A0A7S8IED3_9CHLR|nr:MraY family glycosyltransferase [Phototrophicus methaneseepsis]QPC83535.1 undecaprenyl/decaprenyl-phosphate alpha-N-acetylglucosaminyl 1-phosphate transferase [Phototrophicus methaneseepsis]